jgi:uncharacterized protein YggT (Ycf19 family)
MYDTVHRVLVVVWFIAYMSAIYLALHVMVARFSRNPNGLVPWFFSVLTSPLTWPVRAFLPPQTPTPRVRLIALGAWVGLWLATRLAFWGLGAPPLR